MVNMLPSEESVGKSIDNQVRDSVSKSRNQPVIDTADENRGYLRLKNNNASLKHSIIAILLCFIAGTAWFFIPHPVVVIAIGLVPFAILIVLGKTFYIILGFVIFSFFRIHEVFPFLYPLKIPLLLSLGAIFALSWHVGITRSIKLYWSRELTIISIFFFLVVVGVVMASNRPIAIAYFKGVYWKIALMMFAITYLTTEARHLLITSVSVTISGTVVGIKALLNKANGIGLVEGTRVTIGRDIGSVLGDPNDLALVLMFPTAFAVSLIFYTGKSKWLRILGWLCAITLFFAIIATQSRGGLLGIMTVFGVFGYRKVKNKLLFFTVGAIFALALFVMAGISDRQSGGAAEEGVDASAMGRLYAWEAAVGMAAAHPFTGVGLDNFYSNYYYYSPHWDGLNHAVHSTWFGVLAETGFLGLIVFITMIVFLVRAVLSSMRKIESQLDNVPAIVYSSSQAVLAGLLSTIVSGTFLTQGFTWPLYILAALVIAISSWVENNLSH